MTKLLLDRAIDQRPLVDVAEDIGHRRGGDVTRDRSCVQLLLDAQASASLDVDGRPCVRIRHPLIVERPAFDQLGDRRLDVLFWMLSIEQTRAAFRNRELASGQEPQRVVEGF